MTQVSIIHNPRCSKSRQTLALLEEQGCDIQVIEYLKTPLTKVEIRSILDKLAISPRELMRTKEEEYKAQNLATVEEDEALIQAMVDTPKLIERPIVLANDKAAIGRPPESVLAIL
ncbi:MULTISPECIES: arsenate reductase (glutaredoxin) [Shewanella]|uniref:Arsenate reductase n=1 Tax=Shewanella marisflavi TaxID=260364 RepID=A0AAC9U0K2_9GAMM|nr:MULTISPECIES: arsenate reductase (glutaredoxin) [Shewanella]ASJ96914.1 arsenate reductase (glutaredoxin) [Shewanella marisflavi]MCL1041003.1 arsenate reductase (glutaredoxin) [Shewanella marisflavi]QDF75449.1 arsenate reductase (glutaredoxin) [Shewanella marisflavi]